MCAGDVDVAQFFWRFLPDCLGRLSRSLRLGCSSFSMFALFRVFNGLKMFGSLWSVQVGRTSFELIQVAFCAGCFSCVWSFFGDVLFTLAL